MCGLVGVAGLIGLKEEKAFKELLTVDVLRGPHSTGVCAITADRSILISKEVCLPTNLFKTSSFKNIAKEDVNVLIGHNRYATQGAINSTNAHPFQHGDITGVHNGTLLQQSLLPDWLDYQVDSENLVHSINKIGSEATYSKLNGAAALVWWDKKDSTLHFLRNDERPFCYCYSLDNSTIFWASEAWMLEGILWRNSIYHQTIYETDVHTEYVMDVAKGKGVNYEGVKIKSCTKHKPYVYVRPALPNYIGVSLPKKSGELSSGSPIVFRLSQGASKKGNSYHGFIKGDSSIEVLVLGGAGHPALAALTTNDLKGTVNGLCRRNDKVYKVIVQANSVVEVKTAKKVVDLNLNREFHSTEGLVEMNKREFERLTPAGCTLCSNRDLEFTSDVVFDEMGNAICEDCSQQEWVFDYINYIN